MPDAIGTFDEVNGHNASNIRKKLRMAVLMARWTPTNFITSLVDASNELVIPDGYISVGILHKENALASTPAITVSEVMGYGYAQTLRRDPVNRATTTAFTMLETKKRTLEVYYGVDLTSVQVSSGTKNEIVFDEPDRPESDAWRVLTIGVDGDGADTIYLADFYPRASVNEVAAIASSEADPLSYGVTMGNDLDSALGTAHRQFIAGPGLTTARAAAMGFSRAT